MCKLTRSVHMGVVGFCAAQFAGACPPPGLTIDTRLDGDRMTVTVRGELDNAVSHELRYAMRSALAESVQGIDLDLQEVAFCDCSSLNALLSVRRQALQQSKTVTVRAVSPAVRRILRLTGTRPISSGSDDGPGAAGIGAAAVDGAGQVEGVEGVERALRIEVGQLRRAMQTRPTIDLARGILMAAFGLTPEGAWSTLVMTSQNTNVKLHRVAQELVDSVTGAPLPDGMQDVLSAAVTKVNASPAGMCARSSDEGGGSLDTS